MWTIQEAQASCTDRELVAKARAGSREALDELIGRHYQTCVRLAARILGDPFEAQDEVQNTCRKVFERLDQYEGHAEFISWLRRIVTNQCLMVLRLRRQRQFVFLDNATQEGGGAVQLAATGPNAETQVLEREAQELLQREMRRIPPSLRTVLLLRHVDELEVEDIAQKLDTSVAAVKSRLHRARVELRCRIRRCYGMDGGACSNPTAGFGRLRRAA